MKGIVRLQALIRGHLVSRQAASTLRYTQGIVRLQALSRGRKVRLSDAGREVQKKFGSLVNSFLVALYKSTTDTSFGLFFVLVILYRKLILVNMVSFVSVPVVIFA